MTVETWTEAAAPTALAVWAGEAASAARLAHDLARTPFVPLSLRVLDRDVLDLEATTATVAAALLTGRELGLSPMASLRSIDVVNGTPALRALALGALVLARGHDMWLVESTETRCIMRGQRRGSTHVQEVTWTIDRARRLGIAGRPQWQKQPMAMLVARCRAELARLLAPEAVLGLPYVVEEMGDDTDADPAPVTGVTAVRAPAKRTAQRRRVRSVVDAPLPEPEPEPEPPHDEPPPPDMQTPGEPLPISDAQSAAMHAAFRDLGVVDRDARMALTRGVVRREISSSIQLTQAEASEVLDALADLAEQRSAMGDDPTDDPPFDE